MLFPDRIQAVVFDCDGLLVDTETAWTRAERVIYARHGGEFTPRHKRELLGKSGATAAEMFELHLGLAPGEGFALLVELERLTAQEIAKSAPPMPGAVALVSALRAAGTPIGLASNSPQGLLDLTLPVAGFDGCFDSVLSAHDVGALKPAPDVYLESCRRLGADPALSVALEDSPTGVAAAVAAGMLVVGVPSLPGVDLSAAHLVVSSLALSEVQTAVGLRIAA